MAQKRRALTLDLNAAAGVGSSGLGNFSKNPNWQPHIF